MSEKQPWQLGPRGEGFVVIQLFLFALVGFGPRSLPGWPEWPAPWSTLGMAAGLLLGAAGGLLALAGLWSLGRNVTAVPRPKENAHFVASGAYRLVRHPIYSGIILGALGYALLRNGTLTLLYAAVLFLFFDLKSRREEAWLREKFAEYGEYQQRVRKLIPFVY